MFDLRLTLADCISPADTTHCFTTEEYDWGWPAMASLKELHAPARGFLPGDCLTIRAFMAVHTSRSAITKQRTAGEISLDWLTSCHCPGQCFAARESSLRKGGVPVAPASRLLPGRLI